MILSDSKILENIKDGRIIISPFESSALGSNSYDVRIGSQLLTYRDKILDPKKDHETDLIVIPDEGFIIQPGTLYLGVTKEFTETKDHVIMFEGKSSLARLGLLVHITSGFGDVGFTGKITLELSCIQPIKIYKDMKIGQIYYQTVEGFVINPYNKKSDAKYNNNSSIPMKSQMFKNFPVDEINIQKKDFNSSHLDRFRDSGIPGVDKD